MSKFIFLQKRSLSIINEQANICINCIHFIKSPLLHDSFQEYSKCGKFGEKNVITGKVRHDYAELVRKDENKCGTIGKLFVKK